MTATITVVNVRTDPGPFTYVGRRTHGYGGSPLGNPHPIGRTCPICHARHGRGDAIAAYRTWLAEQMAAGPGNPAVISRAIMYQGSSAKGYQRSSARVYQGSSRIVGESVPA